MAGLCSVRHLDMDVNSRPTTEGWAPLVSLQWLELCCHEELLPAELQRSLCTFTGLRHLQLRCSNEQLPGISSLRQLTCLILHGCEELQRVPQVSQLQQLHRLQLSFCSSLGSLPDGMHSLTQLQELDISW